MASSERAAVIRFKKNIYKKNLKSNHSLNSTQCYSATKASLKVNTKCCIKTHQRREISRIGGKEEDGNDEQAA